MRSPLMASIWVPMIFTLFESLQLNENGDMSLCGAVALDILNLIGTM